MEIQGTDFVRVVVQCLQDRFNSLILASETRLADFSYVNQLDRRILASSSDKIAVGSKSRRSASILVGCDPACVVGSLGSGAICERSLMSAKSRDEGAKMQNNSNRNEPWFPTS